MMAPISQSNGENEKRIYESCINSFKSHSNAIRQDLLLLPFTYKKNEGESV